MNKFTAILENFDGQCKKVTIVAASLEDAWGVAYTKYQNWSVVDIKAK